MFPLVYFYIFFFGLIIGSFLNVVILRLHKKESLLGRSHCPDCKKPIAWYDNIPLLSFLLLRGKCRHCKTKISWQYPAVELATGILFLLAFSKNFELQDFLQVTSYKLQVTRLFRDFFLIAVLIVIFVYDLRWYLILDVVSLPSAAVILILNLLVGHPAYNLCGWNNLWSCNPLSWSGILISGIIGGSFFLVQFLISRGRWVGGGDIRLGLLMGLALGWPYILVALIIAYFAGSLVGLSLVALSRKQMSSQLPFGVFLAPATIVTLFWGQAILNWYLGIIS